MKITLTQSMFLDQFTNSSRSEQFSCDALRMIYDFIEEIDEDAEFDLVAICCEYEESTVDYIISQYRDIDVSECEDDNEKKQVVEDYLQDNACLLGYVDSTDSFVFIQF